MPKKPDSFETFMSQMRVLAGAPVVRVTVRTTERTVRVASTAVPFDPSKRPTRRRPPKR